MSRSIRFAALALALAALLSFVPTAIASVAQEEEAGAKVLGALEAGRVRCSQLKGEDFDHLGEYLMGRMIGSPQAHEAMNQMMTRMMGIGEQRMHEAMGRRFGGCGGGQLPASFGRMMGAINAMGMMGGGMMGGPPGRVRGGPGGMMGGRGWGPGGMMNGSWFSEGSDHSGAPWGAIVGLLVALVLIAGLLLAWLAWRRRPSASADSPAEILRRRYANGELSTEEFRARLDALG